MKKNFYLSFLFFASILLVPLSFSNEIFLNNDKRSSDNQISENPSAKHAVDQEDPFFEIDNVESSKTSITYDFSLNLGNDGTTEDDYSQNWYKGDYPYILPQRTIYIYDQDEWNYSGYESTDALNGIGVPAETVDDTTGSVASASFDSSVYKWPSGSGKGTEVLTGSITTDDPLTPGTIYNDWVIASFYTGLADYYNNTVTYTKHILYKNISPDDSTTLNAKEIEPKFVSVNPNPTSSSVEVTYFLELGQTIHGKPYYLKGVTIFDEENDEFASSDSQKPYGTLKNDSYVLNPKTEYNWKIVATYVDNNESGNNDVNLKKSFSFTTDSKNTQDPSFSTPSVTNIEEDSASIDYKLDMGDDGTGQPYTLNSPVEVYDSTNDELLVKDDEITNDGTIELTGLDPGKSYKIYLKANVSGFEGDPIKSDDIDFTTKSETFTSVAPNLFFDYQNITNTTATLKISVDMLNAGHNSQGERWNLDDYNGIVFYDQNNQLINYKILDYNNTPVNQYVVFELEDLSPNTVYSDLNLSIWYVDSNISSEYTYQLPSFQTTVVDESGLSTIEIFILIITFIFIIISFSYGVYVIIKR